MSTSISPLQLVSIDYERRLKLARRREQRPLKLRIPSFQVIPKPMTACLRSLFDVEGRPSRPDSDLVLEPPTASHLHVRYTEMIALEARTTLVDPTLHSLTILADKSSRIHTQDLPLFLAHFCALAPGLSTVHLALAHDARPEVTFADVPRAIYTLSVSTAAARPRPGSDPRDAWVADRMRAVYSRRNPRARWALVSLARTSVYRTRQGHELTDTITAEASGCADDEKQHHAYVEDVHADVVRAVRALMARPPASLPDFEAVDLGEAAHEGLVALEVARGSRHPMQRVGINTKDKATLARQAAYLRYTAKKEAKHGAPAFAPPKVDSHVSEKAQGNTVPAVKAQGPTARTGPPSWEQYDCGTDFDGQLAALAADYHPELHARVPSCQSHRTSAESDTTSETPSATSGSDADAPQRKENFFWKYVLWRDEQETPFVPGMRGPPPMEWRVAGAGLGYRWSKMREVSLSNEDDRLDAWYLKMWDAGFTYET